jgi:transcriptional regulator
MPDELTIRRRIGDLFREPRTISSVSHDLAIDRRDVEVHVRHILKSARAAGHKVTIEPARCRSCGFVFDATKITKPGKCPECKGSRIYEPLIRIVT